MSLDLILEQINNTTLPKDLKLFSFCLLQTTSLLLQRMGNCLCFCRSLRAATLYGKAAVEDRGLAAAGHPHQPGL